jgi:hypothetical protein
MPRINPRYRYSNVGEVMFAGNSLTEIVFVHAFSIFVIFDCCF